MSITVALLLPLALSVASEAVNTTLVCKPGWKLYQDECFIAVPLKQTWTLAKSICGSPTFGGKLAELVTPAYKSFLVGYMSKTYEKAFAHDLFWLGGSDEGHERHWRWVTSNTDLTYLAWWDNATAPGNNTAANCMAIGAPTHNYFIDLDCTSHNNFVCQTRAEVNQTTNGAHTGNGNQGASQTGSGMQTGTSIVG